MSKHGKRHRGQGKNQEKLTYLSQPCKTSQEKKKSATKWLYNISSARQASDYKSLTEQLINHIKQNFEHRIILHQQSLSKNLSILLCGYPSSKSA